MIKYSVLLFYFLGVLIINQIIGGDVQVRLNAPDVVEAGTEFTVDVTLDKKELESFSRFLQEIPPGLTATGLQSANADFSFQDNRVRFIWLRLPEQNTVTISYNIKVDERLKGTFDLGGRFSYIDNNSRRVVNLEARQVMITPSPNIDPNLIVDINDFGQRVIPDLTTAELGNLACIRRTPSYDPVNNEVVVELLVSKENMERFAKIEEFIPAGFTAVAMETKDAIFTFKDQTAKFLWMNLPADPYFVISYKLIPGVNVPTDHANIQGYFSFIDGTKTTSMGIYEMDADFTGLTKASVNNLIASIPADRIAAPGVPVATRDVTADLPQVTDPGTTRPSRAQPEPRLTQQPDLAFLLEPEAGVYYRVQVAAGHRPVDVRRYFRRLNLTDEIRTESHEGWIKYSIGSWEEYRQARDYRVHIWNTTPINDAFVAAYNTGQRITVQEALMITDQRWYK